MIQQLIRAGRECRGYAAQVQMTCGGKVIGVVIRDRKVACSRAFAEILHDGIGSIFDLGFKLKAGREASVEGDPCSINPLFFQRIENEMAKAVIPHAADPAHVQAETRQAGRDVEFSACDAFDKVLHRTQLARFGGDKHGHGLADRDDIQRLVHGLLLAQQVDVMAGNGG